MWAITARGGPCRGGEEELRREANKELSQKILGQGKDRVCSKYSDLEAEHEAGL
jgi:hypothetical protein